MAWEGKERRRYVRVNVPYPITLRFEEKIISTNTVDISAGGVKIVVEEELNVYQPVALEIFIGEKPLPCQGRVVWIQKKESLDRSGVSLFYTGIEFTNIDKDDRQLLKERAKGLSEISKEEYRVPSVLPTKMVVGAILFIILLLLFFGMATVAHRYLLTRADLMRSPLEIVALQSYPHSEERIDKIEELSETEPIYITITDKGILYVETNREANDAGEIEQLKAHIRDIVKYREGKIIQNGEDPRQYAVVDLPGYRKTVVRASLDEQGKVIDIALKVIIGFFCLLLYIPLGKYIKTRVR